MTRRRVLRSGALVWAVVGAAVALASLRTVNDDARALLVVASIVGPMLAVVAAMQLPRRADRSAGVLLALSAILTPTYFAAVINLPALVVGIALMTVPRSVLPERVPEPIAGVA